MRDSLSDGQIRRWLNYLCSESQQLQFVITEGNERQRDRGKMTHAESEEEKEAETGEKRREGGGVVESKRKIERWRESMFPTRSIELSIILLLSDDSSS